MTMPPTKAPPKLPPKPPTKSPSTGNGTFKPRSGKVAGAQRIGIYGTGGVGKTSLLASLKDIGKKPLVIDLDDGSAALDVCRLSSADGVGSWDALRSAVNDGSLWADYDVCCIDTGTRAEELAEKWVLENVPHEKGHRVERIEDYGFGKGYSHIYGTFLLLLGDLDAHIRTGRDVVIVMHECISTVPNPTGEDYIRYEPRLQSPASGKASIRHRVKEWLDHLLFIGYDVNATKDGKGQGCGTRSIYPQEMPSHVAKSRTLADPIVYTAGSTEVWEAIYKKENSDASS